MRVVITGVSGTHKLESIQRVAGELRGKGHNVILLDAWEAIQAAAKHMGRSVKKETILDLKDLDSLRAVAFSEISESVRNFKNSESSHALVATHACFRWNKYLRRGFDLHYLQKIDPDVYVNLVDDITQVVGRLNSDTQWKERLTESEIITWRDEETFLTEMIAEVQNKRFYLLARAEPVETLVNLISEPKMKKIYLSYPITAILQQDPKLLEEVEAFGNELRTKYVVFNPLSIKDLVGNADKNSENLKSLRENTVWRDFKLINQSDMVVVYYPSEYNSPGVNQEINYGFSNGKKVHLFYPHALSPFWDERVSITHRYNTLEEMRKALL